MRFKDINQQMSEEDENIPQPPSRGDIKKRQAERANVQKIIDAWNERERTKNKTYQGLTYADFPWTIDRSFPDEEGEYQEIDITVYVCGEYERGSAGSYYEPSYPAGYHGIEIVWAEVDSNDPNTTPLTMAEKIKLEQDFNRDGSKLHDRAEQALLDTDSGSYY